MIAPMMDSNKKIDRFFRLLGLFLWILTFVWLRSYFRLRESFLDTFFLVGIPALVYLGIGFFLPRYLISRRGRFEENDEAVED